jgi:hypothetical protein
MHPEITLNTKQTSHKYHHTTVPCFDELDAKVYIAGTVTAP